MKIKFSKLKIMGMSATVPKNVLHMSDLYTHFGEQEVKRIVLSTGIESVYVVNKEMKTSDLCEKAALKLFKSLNISPSSIDAIIFISQTPDFKLPATSCILQDRLSLKNEAVAFDINYGCSGYIYGLYQAALLLKGGNCKRVLVCAGDTISQHLDPEDHKVRLIFGDAGSATLIEHGNNDISFDIRTDGSGYNNLIVPKDETGNDKYLSMNGGAIMEFILREVEPIFNSVLKKQNWVKADLNQVVFHQANQFILKYLCKKLSLNESIVPISVKNYGNTGPASIPLTLCDSYFNSEKKLGKAILSGFGVGLSWGACAVDLTECQLLKVIKC